MDAKRNPIGSFGQVPQGADRMVKMLWVTAESISVAVETLKRRGFQYKM
jgi:N6-adenosine-specific RNA methylase IME4